MARRKPAPRPTRAEVLVTYRTLSAARPTGYPPTATSIARVLGVRRTYVIAELSGLGLAHGPQGNSGKPRVFKAPKVRPRRDRMAKISDPDSLTPRRREFALARRVIDAAGGMTHVAVSRVLGISAARVCQLEQAITLHPAALGRAARVYTDEAAYRRAYAHLDRPTAAAMAAELGCAMPTVYRWAKLLDLPLSRPASRRRAAAPRARVNRLEFQLRRLRAARCHPSIAGGTSPHKIAVALLSELDETLSEAPRSERARSEAADLLAVAAHMVIEQGGNLRQAIDEVSLRLERRLDICEAGHTWEEAKQILDG